MEATKTHNEKPSSDTTSAGAETCKAELHIGDDYGDNRATMKCQGKLGHEGKHFEDWDNEDMIQDDSIAHNCRVEWEGDDRNAGLGAGAFLYDSLEECIEHGYHLTDHDDDGYCNGCGHQDGPGEESE